MSSEVRRDTNVPPEILHRIVSYALAAYIDDVVDGRLALRIAFQQDLSHSALMELYESQASTTIAEMSPVIPLLEVSYTVRQVTLEIVSKVFNIQYIDSGLGRLGGTKKPWMIVIDHQQRVSLVKNDVLKPPLSPDQPVYAHPGEPRYFALHYALVVLKRETEAAWQFVDAFVLPSRHDTRVLDVWRGSPLSVADQWVQYAADTVKLIPDIFREGIFPRVADAVLKARIAALFAIGLHDVRWTLRQARDWHRHTLEEGDPVAVPLWAVGLEENLQGLVDKLQASLHVLPELLAKLDETVRTMPPTKPVDDIIGSRKYLTLIRALVEITNWRAEGDAYEDCRNEARAAHKLFMGRLSARTEAHRTRLRNEASKEAEALMAARRQVLRSPARVFDEEGA